MTDTIFALATPPGRGAVAVIRVSGPEAAGVVTVLAGDLPQPRRATVKALKDTNREILDRALVLWFPEPASFTGEDCAEFHLHGGRAVVDGVTLALIAAGARLADPGEFTRRAFENGKLDLSQAESIADLVDADTSSQARQALDQLGGGLARRYARWREMLIAALGLLEAAVDFPEDDSPSQASLSAEAGLCELQRELRTALVESDRGRQVRDGYRVALIGAPNSGKSSLINRLSERNVAIVSAEPGTTRDIIETPLTIAGYRVLLSDTAGLRQSEDAVEAEGARRAQETGQAASLRLWVVDSSSEAGEWRAAGTLLAAGDICLLNKSDLVEGSDGADACRHATRLGLDVFRVCATTGNIDPVISAIEGHVVRDLAGGEFPAATRVRHEALLGESIEHLTRAHGRMDHPELAAEDVRLAARAMERIAGRIDIEDVLEQVFSTFCIGK